MRRTRLVLPAALALAFALAGCGGDGGGGAGGERMSKADYQAEVKQVGDTLEESVGDLSGAFDNPESLDQVADQIGQLQSAIDDAANDLDNLNPPADAEVAHDKLVEGLNEFVDDLGQVEQAVRDGELKELQEFGEQFSSGTAASVKKIEEATEELKEKGFDVEG